MWVYIWNDTWLPNKNTVAYYPLTANANDYSGNGYNATNNGGTFSEENWWYFSSAYSRINLPSMNIWQTFTVSWWIKLPNWQPTWEQEFNTYRDWSGSHRNLLFWASASWIRGLNGNNSTSSNSKIISATFWTWWNNIVLSKSWTSYSVYMNWTLLETFTGYDVSIPWWYNTVQIPHDDAATSVYTAPWYLKDLIIENKARTAQEVSNYYDRSKWNYWIS